MKTDDWNIQFEIRKPISFTQWRDTRPITALARSLWQWRGFWESCEFLVKLNIRGFFVQGGDLLEAFVVGDSWQTLEAIIRDFVELFI